MLDREILVVDDEKDLRTMIRSIFESAGCTQITTAASGQEALAVMAAVFPAISSSAAESCSVRPDSSRALALEVRVRLRTSPTTPLMRGARS